MRANQLVMRNAARWAAQRRRADQRSEGYLGTITPQNWEFPTEQLTREAREHRIDWLIDNWRTVAAWTAAGLGLATYLGWPWLKKAYAPIRKRVKVDVRR